jgi:Family of unknown function (DUF5906)/Primase C terminal 2 (PriCT-2)
MDEFLRRVLPAGGDYVVTAIPPGGQAREVRGLPTLEAAAATIRKLSTKPLNVYIAIGSYNKKRQAPKAKRALFLDLDSKDFGDKKTAARELGLFCRATGMPMPAILVDSGGGLHAYWPFDTDLDVGPWRALASQLKAKCHELGFKADPPITADAARILRVPTTLNYKYDPPVPCRVLHDSGKVFSPTALLKILIPASAGISILPAAAGIVARGTVPTINADLAAGLEYERPDEATVREMLRHVNIPAQGVERRGVWKNVIAALHHWDNGGETGFDVANEWSATQPAYKGEADVRRTYMSWGKDVPGRVPTTIGTVIKLAREGGWQPPLPPEEAQPTKSPELPDIDTENMDGVEQDFQSRVAAAVNKVRGEASSAAQAAGKVRAPHKEIERILCSQFIYVKGQDTYYNVPNRELFSKECIRDIFTPDMPRSKAGVPMDPCELMRRSPNKVVVDSLGFHPAEGPVFTENGKDYVNVHTAPAALIPPTRAEAKLFADFVDYIFPRPEDQTFRRYWLQFNAHIVQRPGVKIATALLFISETYGIGKSTAAYDIPRLLVGPQNARLVSNDLLEGRFTGYLGDAHLIHLQEVYVNGHWNSSKIANKLKAIVTDPTVSVEKKGQDDYNIPNRLVVTASSNYKNAMLISSKQDRRWGIFELVPNRGWTPGGIEARAYFNKVHAFLKSPRAAGVLRFIFNHISLQGFDPQNPPPMTLAKERMVGMSLSEEQAVVSTACDSGDAPFHRDIFHMDEVRHLIQSETGKILSRQRIQHWFKSVIADADEVKQIRSGNGRLRVWAWRNHDKWRSASPQDIQQELAK